VAVRMAATRLAIDRAAEVMLQLQGYPNPFSV
jgi:hypothetical protein